MCYYLEPVKRQVATPLTAGLPADLICKVRRLHLTTVFVVVLLPRSLPFHHRPPSFVVVLRTRTRAQSNLPSPMTPFLPATV